MRLILHIFPSCYSFYVARFKESMTDVKFDVSANGTLVGLLAVFAFLETCVASSGLVDAERVLF